MSSKQSTQRQSVISSAITKYLKKRVLVRFNGGRQVSGVLRGHDAIVDLVLDDAVETLRDPSDPYILTGKTRYLGLIVAKGTAVTMIYPEDGSEEISNPFVMETELPTAL